MKKPDIARTREPVFAIPLDLPRRGDTPLAASLHRQLRAAIVEGRLAPGSVLPSSRRAAVALGIARNTVMAAYDLLLAEGYVLPRKGACGVVADVGARRPPLDRGGGALQLREIFTAERWQVPQVRHGPAMPLPVRSFRTGVPDHIHFPHDVWRRLSARAWRQWSRRPFDHPPVEGIDSLRAAIAQHVAFARAVACRPEDVMVTAGAQQAFDLLARLLVTPGHTRVAIEDPGYPPLRHAFAAAGAELVPVPVDDEGLRVDLLPTDVRVICVTPSHQSPTGAVLSLSRRAALLEHARAHAAVIVEDDYDSEFRYGDRPLDALRTLDTDGRVFYVGTFTKSLFPAIHTGFLVAPTWAWDGLLAVKRASESHSPGPLQDTLAAFIRDGHLARHVRRMTPVYAERREALVHAIQHSLQPWMRGIPSIAGLHLAAHVVDGASPLHVADALHRHAPGAQTAAEYCMRREAPPMAIFGFGTIDAASIAPAMRELARTLSRKHTR